MINKVNGQKRYTADLTLAGFTTSDLYDGYKPAGYFVKGVVGPNESLVIFGESGALKTFSALDLVMHVATGKEYCGHRVRKTGVLFIAGEGGEGIKRRIMAWLIRHNITAASDQPAIYVATEPADLIQDGPAIKATIAKAEKVLGREVGIVVFDTLAANFGPGDESKAEDMSCAMRTAREACGNSAIILVHHVGHGAKDRERGSYALRATADCRILVERPNDGSLVSMTCLKSKDGKPFDQLNFEIRVVDLGWQDADGDELTSLVLDATDKRVNREPNTKTHKAIVDALRKKGTSMKRAELVKELDPYGISRTSVYRAVGELLATGQLVEGFDKVSLPESEA
jgi:RecA/RadA recombinase